MFMAPSSQVLLPRQMLPSKQRHDWRTILRYWNNFSPSGLAVLCTTYVAGLNRSVMHLLEVNNLQTHFPTRAGLVRAVDGVSFYLQRGELLGLVGESGCGKSMTALSIMRLIAPPRKIVGGEILLEWEDLLNLSESEMRQLRGDDIAMIFQDPMTSLNPVFTVGEQIAEALRLHRKLSRKEARLA